MLVTAFAPLGVDVGTYKVSEVYKQTTFPKSLYVTLGTDGMRWLLVGIS